MRSPGALANLVRSVGATSAREPASPGPASSDGLLARLLALGVRTADPRSVARRTRQVNVAALVALGSMLSLVVVNLSVATSSTLRAAWLALPFTLPLAAVLWLNHLGRRSLARWLVIVASSSALLVNALYVGGGSSGVHLLFPVVALASATLFSRSERALAVSVLLSQLALYLYFELAAELGSADYEAQDPELRTLLRAILGLVAFAVALGIVTHAERSARANEQALAQAATTDPLTGLPNRVALERRLVDVARQLPLRGELAAALYLDLDKFKPVNDTHGHRVGDRLLVSVAQRLSAAVRDVDLAVRLGGDEFVVLLVRLGSDARTAEERALMVAERIRASLDASHALRDERGRSVELQCPVSVGVAVLRPNEEPKELLARADAAMYSAKRGAGPVVLAQGEAHDRA